MDNSHRPPNAFILYSQAMRSQVRQENPSLSNTEVSRLLGKLWKEVPSDIKLQYKHRAAATQEIFKRDHPDYTYRKARRKRALNELLTKSGQAFSVPAQFATDPQTMQMFAGAGYMMPGMFAQPGQVPAGIPNMAMAMATAQAQQAKGIPTQLQQQYANMAGYAAFGNPAQGFPPGMYPYQGK
jgi:transcription factor SOX7/8/10/18 (SOX group E/F)